LKKPDTSRTAGRRNIAEGWQSTRIRFFARKTRLEIGLIILPTTQRPHHRTEGNALDALRGDYQRMLEDGLLLEDAESFDLLMDKCKSIQEQVKRFSAIEDERSGLPSNSATKPS